MNNENWTKGEWAVRSEAIGIIDQSDTQSYGMMNVICRVDKYDVKEWQENAHLIAAAPDMYRELKRQREGLANLIELKLVPEQYIKPIQEEVDRCDELLAKARGKL